MLSRWLVDLYPQPWRERYHDEMLALLEDSPPRLRDVVDLTRGLVVERARAVFEPGDRPGLTLTLLTAGQFAVGAGFGLAGLLAGWAARLWLGPLPDAFQGAAAMLMLGAMIAWAVVGYRKQFWAHQRLEPIPPPFSMRAGMAWLGVLFVAAAMLEWGDGRRTHIALAALGASHQLSLPLWREVGAAARRLWASARELTCAQMELDRCERLAAQGLASPLPQARDAIARIARQREEAMAMLHGLGYRASLAAHTRDGSIAKS